MCAIALNHGEKDKDGAYLVLEINDLCNAYICCGLCTNQHFQEMDSGCLYVPLELAARANGSRSYSINSNATITGHLFQALKSHLQPHT